jgi:two-component system cell cycle response regulator DivK
MSNSHKVKAKNLSLGLHEVLIVEDNINNSDVIQAILNSQEIPSHVVTNAKDALDYCRAEKPRLILMDLGLPNINGLELTKILKASGGIDKVPIIAVTAHTGKEIEEKAEAVGCDGFIEKPFMPKDFMRIVRSYLS